MLEAWVKKFTLKWDKVLGLQYSFCMILFQKSLDTYYSGHKHLSLKVQNVEFKFDIRF